MLLCRNPISLQMVRRVLLAAAVGLSAVTSYGGQVEAAAIQLMPQTKLRVAVVQWLPSKGEYQRWDAVSGEYAVTSDGTVTLSLIGAVPVEGMGPVELGAAIARRLQSATGLLTALNATVTVVEFPPIYVIGTVGLPGAYPYRPGLTVLQALALSGGANRKGAGDSGIKDEVSSLGELQTIRDNILRSIGRLSRLQAERSEVTEVKTPPELAGNEKGEEIMAQERLIFAARAREQQRQLTTLAETKRLFLADIDVLNEKSTALDRNIKLVEEELNNVKGLVERGVATVSRRSDLERAVAALQSNRLDQVTATMRARQNVSESTRSELSLRDRRQTEIANELQDAQANLEKLRVKEDVLVKTLVLTGTSMLVDRSHSLADPTFTYTIVRRSSDEPSEFEATEATVLNPGVVKVALRQKPTPKVGDVAEVRSN